MPPYGFGMSRQTSHDPAGPINPSLDKVCWLTNQSLLPI